jgi:hypothetical protein
MMSEHTDDQDFSKNVACESTLNNVSPGKSREAFDNARLTSLLYRTPKVIGDADFVPEFVPHSGDSPVSQTDPTLPKGQGERAREGTSLPCSAASSCRCEAIP